MSRIKLYIAVFILLAGSTVMAQVKSTSLSHGGTTVMRADGILFSDSLGNNGAEFPSQSGKFLASFGSFWISALTSDNILLQAAPVDLVHPEFWPGPIDTFTRKAKQPDQWMQLWAMDQTLIQTHRSRFQEEGYVMDGRILNWPGNSKSGEALPKVLAPYNDWDKNSLYNPGEGDFPAISGKSSVYSIFNDEYGEHVASKSVPLKAQIQQEVFVPFESLSNTIILKAWIRNMSDFDWKDAYIGYYVTLELGNATDNYVRTDVLRNTVYGYNGDNLDEGVYENQLPVFGITSVTHPISSSMMFSGNGDYRLPVSSAELRNVMIGKLPGSNMKHLGSGGSNFVYPGITDAGHLSGNVTEESDQNAPGTRKMLLCLGPFNIGKGAFQEVELAFWGETTQNPESTATGKADQIRTVLQEQRPVIVEQFRIYPNPVSINSDLNLEFSRSGHRHINILTLDGKSLIHDICNETYTQISLQSLPAGIYLVEIEESGLRYYEKLMIRN